ncbi:molybdopterin-dependent oxidoreductase [Streptomyces canus]|uniref:molybdopterin-dependent oxidoreductase n=1 Tax=Streptomyces canus TaxID=58343 RepID=UPI0033B721C6
MPPAPEITHAMARAEFRYSANLRLTGFTAPGALLATHHNGEPLTAEHGFPLRLVEPRPFGCKNPKGCAESSTSPRTPVLADYEASVAVLGHRAHSRDTKTPLGAAVPRALASAPRAKPGHGIRK